MRKLSIAIDGPAGAGKSSVARMLASQLGYIYLDTGAMYRAITYEALRRGLSEQQPAEVSKMAGQIRMKAEQGKQGMRIFLNGREVTPFLRTEAVSTHVSGIAAIPRVREVLVAMQRALAAGGGVVLDGRDIGTVVLPKADVKVFLTASAEERAKRRFREMKGGTEKMSLSAIEANIRRRDRVDAERQVSPLRAAEDAVLIDNSSMTLKETAEAIAGLCRRAQGASL